MNDMQRCAGGCGKRGPRSNTGERGAIARHRDEYRFQSEQTHVTSIAAAV
jgi:hypothetical protein